MKTEVKMAKMYLERREDYEILDVEFECALGSIDIVAKDDSDGSIVLIEVLSQTCANVEEPKITSAKRGQLERVAIGYLVAHEEISDLPVRFDRLTVVKLGDDVNRVLIRHHINALGKSNND